MALHVSIFRKRYPLYKYAVVALVTAGVAVFTLHQPTSASKKQKAREGGSSVWGLFLLSINLLFDGLTNSTQDYIFGTFKPYTGQQMMVAMNTLSTALTVGWLFVSPWLGSTDLGAWLGLDFRAGQGEFGQALAFLQRHPSVGWDVLGFAACGAFGQLFICKFEFQSGGSFASLTADPSLHVVEIFLVAIGHRDRDEEDDDYDAIGSLFWSQIDWHAMARSGPCVWRNRRRRCHSAAGESYEGKIQTRGK